MTGKKLLSKAGMPWVMAVAAGLLAVPPLEASPFAYIPNHGDNTFSVVDVGTGTVVTTVPLGTAYLVGSAVTPDGTRVYVTDGLQNVVKVINTATLAVSATINVGWSPHGLAVSPDGNQVYVANYTDGNISVIQASSNTVVGTIAVGAGPFAVAFSPDGTKAYVQNIDARTVSVINTATSTVTATVPVGANPRGIAVSPDGARAYVPNFDDNTVSVIDTASNAVVATVGVGGSPHSVAVTPDSSRVFVPNSASDTVSVISAVSNTVVNTITVGDGPRFVAATPDGGRVLVVNNFANSISFIKTSNETVIDTVPVGPDPSVLGLFIGGPSCAQQPSGQVSGWAGDGNALDMVGVQHGTMQSGAGFAAGLVGHAFSFGGAGDDLEVGGGVGDFGSSAFTVDFWMYSSVAGSNTPILGKSHANGGLGWDIRLSNSAIQIVGVNGWGFNITSDAAATPGEWHHVALAAATDTVSLYVDGELKGSCPRGPISQTANLFRVGYLADFYYSGPEFDGLIDELEIFNRALTGSEVTATYRSGIAGRCRSCAPAPSGMLSFWKAEGNGLDTIGGHPVTPAGGASFATGKVEQAFAFDGVDAFQQSSYNFPFVGDFAFSAWVKPRQTGSLAFVLGTEDGFSASDGGWGLHWDNPAGHFSFGAGCGGGTWAWASTPRVYAPDLWHHVAGMFDGGWGRIFVDGALAVEFPRSCPIIPGTDLRMGTYPNRPVRFFRGSLDEVAVFGRALSATEVGAISNAGTAGMCGPDLIFANGFEG
jgi:YVTN family beta-propeller protein